MGASWQMQSFGKTHTKGKAEWRKLKKGPPENLDELAIMFEHTAVDRSTACTPGDNLDEENDATDHGEQGDDDDVSPMSTSTMKRGTNSTAYVTLLTRGSQIEKDILYLTKEQSIICQNFVKALDRKAVRNYSITTTPPFVMLLRGRLMF